MAINPNFTFADPALQAQVVNMAQVQAAADAARAQQMTQTLAELSRQRQATADREERRAVRESDIRRQEGATAENRRQFDESLKFNREAEASRTTAEATRRKEGEQREQYSAVLRAIEAADGRSLPTASELQARIGDLLPQHKTLLMEARDRKFAQLKNDALLISADVESRNASIGSDDPSKPGTKLTADTLRRRSPFSNNIIVGPDGRLQSLAIRPREDAVLGSEPEPAPAPASDRVSGLRGFIERRMAGASAPSGPAESIEAIQARNRGGGVAPGAGMLGIAGSGQHILPTASPQMFVPTQATPSTEDIVGDLIRNPRPAARFALSPGDIEESTLIPSEQFDVRPGGFTGGERLLQRGARLIESRPDAAMRRLMEARKTYPEAELVERPDGVFIKPLPRRMFYAPEMEELLAPPVFAPQY